VTITESALVPPAQSHQASHCPVSRQLRTDAAFVTRDRYRSAVHGWGRAQRKRHDLQFGPGVHPVKNRQTLSIAAAVLDP